MAKRGTQDSDVFRRVSFTPGEDLFVIEMGLMMDTLNRSVKPS